MSSAFDSKPHFASEERVPANKKTRERVSSTPLPKTFSDSSRQFSGVQAKRRTRFQDDFVGNHPGSDSPGEYLVPREPLSYQNVKYEDDNVRFLATGERKRKLYSSDRQRPGFEFSTATIQRLNVFPDGVARAGLGADINQEKLMGSEIGNALTDISNFLKDGLPRQGAFSENDFKQFIQQGIIPPYDPAAPYADYLQLIRSEAVKSKGMQQIVLNQYLQRLLNPIPPAPVAAPVVPGAPIVPLAPPAPVAPVVPALGAGPVAGGAPVVPPVGGAPIVPPAGGAPIVAAKKHPIVPPLSGFATLDPATKKALIETKFDEIIASRKQEIINEINRVKAEVKSIINDENIAGRPVPAQLQSIEDKIAMFDEAKFNKNHKGTTPSAAKLSKTNKEALDALAAFLASKGADPSGQQLLTPPGTPTDLSPASTPSGSPSGSRRGSVATDDQAVIDALNEYDGLVNSNMGGASSISEKKLKELLKVVALTSSSFTMAPLKEEDIDKMNQKQLALTLSYRKSEIDKEIAAKLGGTAGSTTASSAVASSAASSGMQALLDFYKEKVPKPITNISASEYKQQITGLLGKLSDLDTIDSLTKQEAKDQLNFLLTYFVAPTDYSKGAAQNYRKAKLILERTIYLDKPDQDYIDNVMQAQAPQIKTFESQIPIKK